MIKLKTTVLAFMLGAFATGISAQSFNGMHKYDGEHKNELNAYFVGGDNVVADWFGGAAVSYKRHLTDRWHVGADAQAQLGKQLYSVDIQGGYRLPYKWMDFYIDGKAMYNRYHKWHTNETAFNLSVTWETPYFNLRVGESLITYHLLHARYTEPLTLTFGTGVSIRPRWNPWNIGLFFRNYDDFYYENWNINWGLNFYAPLTIVHKDMQLFGEFNVRPAGSMSQLASKYETSGKLGIKYVW
jgi:hypothetical protein